MKHIRINRRFTQIAVICSVLLPAIAFAGEKISIGSTTDILNKAVTQKTRSTSFSLVSTANEEIPLQIRDYYYEKGELSITGKPTSQLNREFILKGDSANIYGWVVDYDKNIAYEYTTDNEGKVVAEEVPVTKIYPVCDIDPEEVAKEPASYAPRWTTGPELHVGIYKGQDVTKLESQPGCKKVFYLDIVDIMNGTEPKTELADNLKSKEEVFKLWQSVAAGFSNFKMNVTTNPKVYAAAGVPNSGVAKFWNKAGRSNSPLNAFGTTNASTNYRNNGQGYGIGRTAFHEIGHTMGMDHDRGDNGATEYFVGLSKYQWCPIMGNYWYADGWANALFQWCRSEYTGGTTFEDDLARVNRYVEYCDDDIPTTTPLVIKGTAISPENNRGQIARATDTDSFTFSVGAGGGHLTLHADRTEYIGGAMLDVDLTLKNASGATVANSNPVKARFADLNLDLPAGAYTLVVAGGAEGTPKDGFPNYSSLGYYAMEGTLTGGVVSMSSHEKVNTSLALTPLENQIQYSIPSQLEGKSFSISLFNLKGLEVFTHEGTSKSGTHSIPVGTNLSKGYYICRLSVGATQVTIPFINK